MCQHVLIVIDFIIVFCWPQSQWGRTFIIIWDEWMKVVQKLIFKLIEKGIKNTTVWFKPNLLTERWHQNALWWRIAKTHVAVYRLNNNAAWMQFYSQLLNTTVTSVTFKHCHLIARVSRWVIISHLWPFKTTIFLLVSFNHFLFLLTKGHEANNPMDTLLQMFVSK